MEGVYEPSEDARQKREDQRELVRLRREADERARKRKKERDDGPEPENE